MPFKSKKPVAIKTGSLQELGDSVVDLAKYTEDEFAEVASAIQNPEAMKVYNVVPPKPRQGMIVYADGTHWNPGSGEGVYRYGADAAWHYLG